MLVIALDGTYELEPRRSTPARPAGLNDAPVRRRQAWPIDGLSRPDAARTIARRESRGSAARPAT